MSVSLSNSLPPPPTSAASAGTSLTPTESTRNAEPLAVRGEFEVTSAPRRIDALVIVMRLSKPALYQNMPIYAEEEFSSSAAAFLAGQSQDIAIGNDHSVLSHLLVLPYSFG